MSTLLAKPSHKVCEEFDKIILNQASFLDSRDSNNFDWSPLPQVHNQV